ncbi:MAG: hypothetical protein KatS3mg077_2411 [Candidatus Binatia bacterium]|nr:MAG: hypothetical protein KatS3mg077_2411 [Candidatus Binatia bacterium]
MRKLNPRECVLFSGGLKGAEACFGATAERYGVEEVTFTFEGHPVERVRGLRVLTHEELQKGDVSLAYVSKLMHRHYPATDYFKKVLQTIWYQVNSAQEVFVVGTILPDDTVKGGTGWGAEFAKLCNKVLFVFDQARNDWFRWNGQQWVAETPVIAHHHFCGTGTRYLEPNGRQAIEDLFARSFA